MTADHGARITPSEEHFRLLVANIQDYAIFLLDPEGRVVSWNVGAERAKGYRADEILGRHFSCFFPEEDVRSGKPERELEAAKAQGHVEDEGWRLRKDGSRFWADVVITALHDEAGQLRGFAKVTRDLTERKQTEERRARLLQEQVARREAEASERRHRALTEAIPQIVWTARPDGALDFVSGRWAEYTGSGAEQAHGQGWRAALHPDDQRSYLDRWDLAVERGEPFEIEVRLLRAADGAYRWQLARALPLRDEDGQIVQWFGTWTDIDDRKRAEQAQREAKEAAEAASSAKDDFLAMLSHELRTPLTPVLMAVTALLEEPSDANAAALPPTLEMIRRNVELEARLIDDLIELTQLGQGPLQLNREVVDVHDLIRWALDDHWNDLQGSKLRLEVDLRAADPHVDADPARLRQAFGHLIRNAEKFTPDGGTLAVRSRNASSPEGTRLVLEFADNGVGIAPGALPRVFNAFEQGEAGYVRRFGGLGSGLAICRRIIERTVGA